MYKNFHFLIMETQQTLFHSIKMDKNGMFEFECLLRTNQLDLSNASAKTLKYQSLSIMCVKIRGRGLAEHPQTRAFSCQVYYVFGTRWPL